MTFRIDCFDEQLASRTTAEEWDRIVSVRNNPCFLNGMFSYLELMPIYFSDNVILNKIVTEAWRFEMLVYLLYLYDIYDSADPRSGLTVTNLQKLCEQQKCASRGRVLAILGIMGLGGYLHRSTAERDRRVVRLQPSDQFISIVEGWNRRIFQIIDSIHPEAELARAHAMHPRFGWDMRRRGAECLLGGWKLLEPFPEVFHFVSRDGGWMLLLTCIGRSLQLGEGTRIEPVSIDLKSFGARFGVSRSHLRRLLESAHREKLLVSPPRDGANIVPSEHLTASFLACMASELGNYRLWALEAKARLEG